ncbi:MAG: hypothetical protein M3336_00875 [Chloroflexota bacterium]|nr:hypothetical protein [Chloroflexota bacterium]
MNRGVPKTGGGPLFITVEARAMNRYHSELNLAIWAMLLIIAVLMRAG